MSDPAAAIKQSQDPRDHQQNKFLEPCVKQQQQQQFSDVSTTFDDSLAKVRKPYTITKQRERWTEEEHQKFLEALKLYGRAWRRIEEHIGTKTAVQIRSHAQKFFCKLEREQATGSIVPGTPQDIDIPPPRPKRKPSHPYPRKANTELSPVALPATVFEERQCPISMDVAEARRDELKLFGHTVVVPTATRAVAAEANASKAAKDVESGEEMETELEKNPSNASDISMLGSENDSSNDQSGNRSTELKKDGTPGVADQQQELAALYYSRFWESFQASGRVLPFNFGVDQGSPAIPVWQPSQYPAAGWPGGVDLTSAFVRSMLAGTPPDIYSRESSPAAFAAATIAAASAWWALQSSVHPGLLPQRMYPVPEAARSHGNPDAEAQIDKADAMEMPLDDDENANASPRSKRLSSSFEDEDDKRRVRSRSSSKEDHQPPSSSGSDDGGDAAAQANGDGDASGNSGPSSNSSRCGTAEATNVKCEESSSDKEKTEDETVTEEAAPAPTAGFKVPGFQQSSGHHPALHHRFRRARPCRSSGSEGDQRKEVSQEGRMAFQALFSHHKLPQTFMQRTGCREDQQQQQQHQQQQQQYARRCVPDSEASDLDSIHDNIKNSGSNNNTMSYTAAKAAQADKTMITSSKNTGGSAGAASSIASEGSPVPSILSSAATKCRRRSGFVPYCRASSNAGCVTTGGDGGGGNTIAGNLKVRGSSSCGLEDHQQQSSSVSLPLIVEEEVKQS